MTTVISGSYPAVNSDSDATVNGLTVGKGGGLVSSATVVGNGAMAATNTGAFNSAFGNVASASNTSGAENTSVGAYALFSNTTGTGNTAIGKQALATNVSGGSNTALGTEALIVSTGSNNTAVGRGALVANTTASSNTAVGFEAAKANTTGQGITAIGKSVLVANTTGNSNVGVGGTRDGALSGALISNTTGSENIAMGVGAMSGNTTGSANVAIGHSALQGNTTSSNNTAIGYEAGTINTGGDNTFVGYYAGKSITSASQTVFVGAYSGQNTTGSNNTFVGYGAGYTVTSGTKNTIIGVYNGNQGGLDIRTASNYIVLSDGDGNPRLISDGSGFIGIGANPVTSGAASGRLFVSTSSGNGICSNATVGTGYRFASNALSEGGTFYHMNIIENGTQRGSITSNGSVTLYNTTSDYRLKENVLPMAGALDKVAALKPVTYDWIESKAKGQGFIAHELQAVIPDAVVGVKDAVDSEGNPKYQQIDTSVLVATLVSAIQELKAEFDAYKATHP
jgi:hypothetical protein